MKVLILADPSAAHTIKWVNSLSKKGIKIFLFGLSDINISDYDGLDNFEYFASGYSGELFSLQDGSLKKIVYLQKLAKLKEIIKNFAPDILHAHYASSYGLFGALSGFHPYAISVWGSDVYSFPNRSPVHRKILTYNLSRADVVLSTSKTMASETARYTDKKIEVTPFGINMEEFKPGKEYSLFPENTIVIGTVKSLESHYGVEYLIKAFRIVKDRHPSLPLKLLIVGKGTQAAALNKLAEDLKISGDTLFTGYINYGEVAKYQRMLDISVSVSTSESFGVAVLEASACGKPVVVSDAGGLPEIVEDGVTGIVVKKEDAAKTADAIEQLIINPELRARLGRQGRERVAKLYNLEDNIQQMINIYKRLCGK